MFKRFWRCAKEKTAEELLNQSLIDMTDTWLLNEDNNIWKQWVDRKKRETRDLINLLSLDIKESFKRKIIFLLLFPDDSINPIYWTGKLGKFYHNTDFLKSLPEEFQNLASDIIIELISMFKPVHNEYPTTNTQVMPGITIFSSIQDKYHDALYFYNDCILTLMELAPSEITKKIFPYFSLNDISVYCGMEDASGYNPFKRLLSGNIDKKWKLEADQKMRQIIMDEFSGQSFPRENWENAFRCYSNIISFQFYRGKEGLAYDIEILADQYMFLTDTDNFSGLKVINSWELNYAFHIFSDDKYRLLRYRIARSVINEKEDGLSIHDEETLHIGKNILDDFGQLDPELAGRLRPIIETGEKAVKESKESKAAKQKEEEESMRLIMK